MAEALGRVTDYVENPEKTNGGELVTAYQCNSAIAYHLRQSFKPGEITPELANKIGYDLAMSLTKGKHAFIVCIHVDKQHIHSHIVFNSTTLDCSRKFKNFWGSSFAVRKISDLLCLENGLSVIENPKPSRGSYGTWLGGDKPPAVRERLEQLPSIQSLKQEYAALLDENKKLYPEQKKAKAEMMELLTAKHNAVRILGLTEQNIRQEQRQEER